MTQTSPPQSNNGKEPISPQSHSGKVPSQETLFPIPGELISTQQQAGQKSDQSRNLKRDQERLTKDHRKQRVVPRQWWRLPKILGAAPKFKLTTWKNPGFGNDLISLASLKNLYFSGLHCFAGTSKGGAELPEPPDPGQSDSGLRTRAAAMAIAISVFPVLTVGTATYYFASQSFEQIGQAKQAEINERRLLLPILLIGTGAAAMLSGALAALWASRTIGLATTTAAVASAQAGKKELKERLQSLKDATEKIHSSLKEEDVLKATVREARRAITADRVLIYSLEEQSWGKVIAESVAPTWPKALGVTLDDSCLNPEELEQYQNGRIQAINNIYKANLTPSHLELLEPLAVKANLVAPIFSQGNLLGLLIAHQCSEIRAWQRSEIDLFSQLGKQAGLALEYTKLLADYARLQKQADSFREWRQFLTEASEQIPSFKEVTQAVLNQTQAVANTAEEMAAKIQQVELQMLKTSQTVKAEEETVNSAVDSLAAVQGTMAEARAKVKHLIEYCQKNSQVVSLIKELGMQVTQQAIGRTIKAGQAGDGDLTQEHLVFLAETVRSSMEELATAIAEIESFTGEIETKAKELVATIEVGTQQAVSGTELIEETRQKLNQIAIANYRIITLISRIAQAATDQVSTSTCASQSLETVASLASQTSESKRESRRPIQ